MDEEYDYFEVTICEECGSVNGCEHREENRNVIEPTETEDFADDSNFSQASFASNHFENASENQKESTIEELLISFIENKPPLWNHRIPLMERTKTIKEKLWIEILTEFGDIDLSLAVIQKKWKNLRDTYIKTKAEVEAYVPTGAPQKKRKRVWKHYESLKILSDKVVTRSTISSFSSVLKSPSGSEGNLNSFSTPIKTSRKNKSDDNGEAILRAIEKVTEPTTAAEKVNPICIRLSEMMSKLPGRERALLEMKLLKHAKLICNFFRMK